MFPELNFLVEELISEHAWLRERFAKAEAQGMSVDQLTQATLRGIATQKYKDEVSEGAEIETERYRDEEAAEEGEAPPDAEQESEDEASDTI